MKRILRLAVSVMMLSATVMAAQNSQTFYLATAARAGKVQFLAEYAK
jgi:opacity protein-like surface antigen